MTPEDQSACDTEALLALMPWARRLAGRLVQTPELADDLAQDACVAALEGRSFSAAQRQGESQAKAWLSSVARKLAYKSHRGESARRAREKRAAQPEVLTGTPTDEVAQMQMQRRLAEAVLDLDEPYRSTMILRFLNELSYAEIAEHHSVSQAAVRQRVSRGLSQLRERLESEFGGDRSAMCLALLHFWRGDDAALAALSAGSAVQMGALAVGTKIALAFAALFIVAIGAWFVQSRQADIDQASVLALEPPSVLATAEPKIESPESSVRKLALEPVEVSEPAGNLAEVDRVHDLHGRVLDPNGAPIEGAQVLVSKRPARTLSVLDPDFQAVEHDFGSTLTDARGEFKISLPLGNPFEVQVSKEGFAAFKVGPRQPGEFLEVRLTPGTRLRGRVTADQDGAPVANCLIRGTLIEDMYTRLFEIRTDRNGEYQVDDLQAARVRLSVTPREHSRIFQIDLRLPVGGELIRDIEVRPSRPIRGQVVDAETREPIGGALVSDGVYEGDPTRTDANGNYVLEGFSHSRWFAVYAEALGYAKAGKSLPGPTQGETKVDFELQRGWSLTGRLEDQHGDPVRGAYVAAISEYTFGSSGGIVNPDWRATASNEHGQFEIHSLVMDSKYFLLLRAEGVAVTTHDLPRPNPPGAMLELETLVLRPGARISGSVVGLKGQPAIARQVILRGHSANQEKFIELDSPKWMHDPGERRLKTDDLGRFCIGDVAPGSYRVIVDERVEGGVSEEFVVAEGQVLTGLELRYSAGLTISGTIRDTQGEPIPDLFVRAFRSGEDVDWADLVQSDLDGHFEFVHVDPGLYRLETNAGFPDIAQQQYADFELEEVPAGSEGNDFVLELALVTSGRVLWADGTPVVHAQIAIVGDAPTANSMIRTDQEGRFSLRLAPGRVVDLAAWATKGSGMKETVSASALVPAVTAGSEGVLIELERAD